MTKRMYYGQAINDALRMEMRKDPEIFLFGQDIAVNGGGFKVTDGLLEEFGAERVLDAPISETLIAGGAVGAAITGSRPVVELSFADFVSVAMDELYNKAAKWRYMHGGNFKVPVVYRTAMGFVNGAGPEHSQCPEALFMGCPGMKVVVPGTPADAKGLLEAAIRDDGPVLFFEHKQLLGLQGEVPEGEYVIPLGKADIKRQGTDVTVIAWSFMLHRSLEAAELLAKEGISVEVIDPRTLVPFDKATVLASIKKTGRVAIVHEAPKTGGPGAEIAAMISEEAMYDLQAPILRIGGADVPMPQNLALEPLCIPSTEQIVAGIKSLLK